VRKSEPTNYFRNSNVWLEISAKSKLLNTLALSRKDLLTQIAANDLGIAEIDSQLSKAMVENNKRIAEIDSQLRQAEVNLIPGAAGSRFQNGLLKAHSPGFVTNSSEPILKIVPDDALTAKVFITNRGFVKNECWCPYWLLSL